MKHLKSYNETVWRVNGEPVNKVTGGRKKMSDIIDNKLHSLNVIDHYTYQWSEPEKQYSMPYEMQKSRLELTLWSRNGVPIDEIESKLTTLFKYLNENNICALRCVFSFREDSTDKPGDFRKTQIFVDENGDFFFDENTPDDFSISSIKSIDITFQYIDNMEDYTDEYIKKYNSLFKYL
jgi:hypothetical protein